MMFFHLLFIWISLFSISCGTVLYNTLKKIVESKLTANGESLFINDIAAQLKESIGRASEILGLEHFEDSECEIDYSPFCPDGWVYAGDGMHCNVGLFTLNHGTCGRVLDFSNKSPLNKLKLSQDCDLKWPCKNDDIYAPENDSVCPLFWIYRDGACVASADYNGPCDLKLSFDDKSEKERIEISHRCNLQWNRKADLLNPQINWNTPCPLGWIITKSHDQLNDVTTCVLDIGQSSICDVLTFRSLKDKQDATKRCGLVWPFKKRPFDIPNIKCPFSWKYDFDLDLCIAPATYSGPCELRISPETFDKIDKTIWSITCGMVFTYTEPPSQNINTFKHKRASKVIYGDGPIEETLKILKRSHINSNVSRPAVLDMKLNKLMKLKENTKNEKFQSTLEYTINNLKRRIEKLGSPQFLQLKKVNLVTDCPYGWKRYGEICVAPDSYRRIFPNCPYVVNIGNFNIEHCRVKRQQYCIEDFTRYPCPLGWKAKTVLLDVIHTICIAPMGYERIQDCGSKVDFTGFSTGFKKRWAYACNAHFPCIDDKVDGSCAENYFWECPAEWEHSGSECIAPEDYRGPCDNIVHTNQLNNNDEKLNFSIRCQAPWPCIDYCRRDYSEDCPNDWIRIGNECKLQKKDEIGSCGDSIIIPKVWNIYSKEETEFHCKVSWPCRQKSEIPNMKFED